nr:uncharacterized protein LOC106690630 isoform X2 [Halyomorpha halys]
MDIILIYGSLSVKDHCHYPFVNITRKQYKRKPYPQKRKKKKRGHDCSNNRNWLRNSTCPFQNFLREYRKKFGKETNSALIACKGKAEWKKMPYRTMHKYFQQAEQARRRGYI